MVAYRPPIRSQLVRTDEPPHAVPETPGPQRFGDPPHDQGDAAETLRTIAEREYGDQRQWSIIFERNKWRFDDQDPQAIYPGMDLDIPELIA